ncbi:hypothetical protein LTR86_010816 [Recurvomyces mirabilis]|nr:hypothetical protein LTR86_010816 [Recurvomyces mirabilis]
MSDALPQSAIRLQTQRIVAPLKSGLLRETWVDRDDDETPHHIAQWRDRHADTEPYPAVQADGDARVALEDDTSVSEDFIIRSEESNEEEVMDEENQEKGNDLEQRVVEDEEKDDKKKGEDAEVGPADEGDGVDYDPRASGEDDDGADDDGADDDGVDDDGADDDGAASEPTRAIEVSARKAGNKAHDEDPAEHIPAAEDVETEMSAIQTIRGEEPKGAKHRSRDTVEQVVQYRKQVQQAEHDGNSGNPPPTIPR